MPPRGCSQKGRRTMPPSKMLGKGGDQTGRTIANRKARRLGHLSAGWYVMATACHLGGVRGEADF